MKLFYRGICLGMFCALALSSGAQAKPYDLPYIGEMDDYRTKYEDTFVHLARDFNLGFVELRAANPFVDPWLPGAGTKLILPSKHILPDAPREGVVINLADMRLYAYYDKNKPPFSTPVGVGREGLNTPVGTTTIVRKVENPIWRPTERMRKEDPKLPAVVYPGDENPMGTHALYLGWSQYAIHGTNKPFGIGRRSSSGCLRLYPESITRVYEMFPVGTKVTVVNQPIKVAWIGDELFLEASPTVEQSVQMEEMGEVPEQKLSNAEMKYIIKAAGPYKDRLRWPTIRKAIKERNSYPVAIARRPSVSVEGDKVVEGEAPNLDTPEEARDLIDGYVPPKKEQKPQKQSKAITIEKPRDISQASESNLSGVQPQAGDEKDEAYSEDASPVKKSTQSEVLRENSARTALRGSGPAQNPKPQTPRGLPVLYEGNESSLNSRTFNP